ncbi:FliM/FliN family flagellar motor switch protein [Candidatus Symbiopectobacterium sp. NZEC135]|uniref:FliM/FliN family flagellar motor switch protein n=1 Tax=Candidatus Symbiopectobacterium sp. NZEC135 TaxID=2820471 RepID=UPI002225D8F3|nr:FliM/FliN family flagellar motor switch protein [Candidatus Symbiopectobacterium sp. NZEC135]MCW2478382.1 FliM/FliN family flagellar motor switch protein [Candidatus Symbiopectobacterium sp. NZEC135]
MDVRERLRRRLRQVNVAGETALAFPGSEIVLPSPSRRYLSLDLADEEQNEARAWVDADEWAAASGCELPGIAWEQVPLGYLSRWLCHHQPDWSVANKRWVIQQVAIPEDSLPGSLIRIPARPCSLLCCDWPKNQDQALLISRPWLEHLPFSLRYMLGRTRLPLAQLVTMVTGDLMRIEHYDPMLLIEHYPIAHFYLTQDLEVFVEEFYIADSDDALREEDEITFEWMNLPINIEFVLDNVTLTVGELDDLQPGAQLPLNSNAEKKIRIYLNRKLFARGELVVLDDGSLAVEVNSMNGAVTRQTDSMYAE